MTLSPLRHNRLDYILRNNGFHTPQDAGPEWVAADATYAPGRCYLRYDPTTDDRLIVATSLDHVARVFARERDGARVDAALPAGAVAAFRIGIDRAHGAVRRIFELSKALPTAPVDRYRKKIRALPSSTEAERVVIQRIGQDVFREALFDYWSGRCAVTGLDQRDLLRASHMKPWAACDHDEERLDPMNGLLLAAHWDAAFDRGLVTFDDDGFAQASEKLVPSARALLALDQGGKQPRIALTPEHRAYLDHHRRHVWQR